MAVLLPPPATEANEPALSSDGSVLLDTQGNVHRSEGFRPPLDIRPEDAWGVPEAEPRVAQPEPTARSGTDLVDVGMVDVSQGKWHLRDSDTGLVTSFFYGNPGDRPISGDWDGNGTATPGLYRQGDGFFYARNSNTQGPADAECFAGDPSDIPVVGDWDGDGDDNLGIYRPSEQKFYLFTTTCTGAPMGAAQIVVGFGNPGDKPVAGDWDGDGIDEIGLHRESTGFFYWRNTLDTGIASGEIFFGDPGDRFVAGDWGVVDGLDTPAIFRASTLAFYFRHTLTQGVADAQFTWPPAEADWLPVSGEFGVLLGGKRLPMVNDPLGLVVAARELRIYTQDDDHVGVWICDVPRPGELITHAQAIDQLNANIVPYFEALSGGVYRPVFSAAGSVSATDPHSCVAAVEAAADGSNEAALILVDEHFGGFAAPNQFLEFFGHPPQPTTFPGNGRHAVVGTVPFEHVQLLAAHEMGHTLHWPHSYSGVTGSEYDNPSDVMSGNLAVSGGSASANYATPVYNLYQAGWIDPSDVFVWDGTTSELLVTPFDSPGTHMIVIPTEFPGVFFTAGARISSTYDPIPAAFEGVEVFIIDQFCFDSTCPGIFRRMFQHPPSPYAADHAVKPGETVDIEGVSLTVLAQEGSGYRVRVGG
jgi:hypothetical protein